MKWRGWIFIPAPFSRGQEGFLSSFSLFPKYYGVGAWCVLICKANGIVIKIGEQWEKDCIWTQEIPAFPHFFGFYWDPNHPISGHSEGSCFSLSVYGPLRFTRCLISCHLAPAPISLLIPSYLPAVTFIEFGRTDMLTIFTLPLHTHEMQLCLFSYLISIIRIL